MSIFRLSILSLSSSKNGAVGQDAERKSLMTNAGPHGFRIKDRANSGGLESTSAADESFAQSAASKRASQYIFAGTIKKRSDRLCSKSSCAVSGPIAHGTRSIITCSRAHERFANSASTISGVIEKTIARRNPSRCKMRSKRSSKLTPHNSIKALGASAIKIGRMFSIAREINGGAARCQLSATYWDYNLPQGWQRHLSPIN